MNLLAIKSLVRVAIVMVTINTSALAASITVSGPTVRIPGFEQVPTILQLTGYNSGYPVRWLRNGILMGEGPTLQVTQAGTYFAQINASTDLNNTLWIAAGSMNVAALSHNINMTGSNPLNPSVNVTSLCLQTNASAYIMSRTWSYNGKIGYSNSSCFTVWQPGDYTVQVTYQYGTQTTTLTTNAVNILAAASAPIVSYSKLTINPVEATPILTVNNYSSFGSIWLYKNGQSAGALSTSSITIASPGRYFFYGIIPGTPALYSYEYSIEKVSIPTPIIFKDASVLTYEDPEIRLEVTENYNGGYTWYFNGAMITGATSKHIDIVRPGDYKVTACAIHSDGQTECKTSSPILITGETLKVNYVAKNTARVEGIMNHEQMYNLPKEQLSHVITYLDGFARPLQQVSWQNSPQGEDLRTINVYDDFGREYKKYLPYVSGTDGKYHYVNPANPATLQDFYQAANDNIANTTKPYAVTVFEPSPLNIVKEQGAAGEDWQPGTGHTKINSLNIYKQTPTSKVLKWKENTEGQLEAIGYYANGSLLIAELTDEHGNSHREYTNENGEKILVEMPGDGGERLYTYTLYDELGRVKNVITPMAIKTVTSVPFKISETDQKKWCYTYQYDERGRQTSKQIPGAEPVFQVYDFWNRTVLSQTGAQRVNHLWSYVKYDGLDRPVMI
jgi:hypothetical protein